MTTEEHRLKDIAGKYMSFKLANEVYGVEILKVRELIQMLDITRVPRTRDFVSGVVNLRGKVHAVIDLRLKLGMEKIDVTNQNAIIIVQHSDGTSENVTGIIVDEVLEVLDISNEQVEPLPDLGSGKDNENYIMAVGKVNDRVVFLLDIDGILIGDDVMKA
jgi:purine-binding chemotaxis protein CheW